jgi:serine/threonine protein kinase
MGAVWLALETELGERPVAVKRMEGRDLGMAPRAMDASGVGRAGRDTCAALEYARGMGVVHRDIKPGNLFLCDTGQVKVADFGIARAVSGTSLTATGQGVHLPPARRRPGNRLLPPSARHQNTPECRQASPNISAATRQSRLSARHLEARR